MNSVTLFLIELVVVLFLGYIAKRKAEKRLQKTITKEKPKKPFRIEQIIIIAIYVITFSLIGYLYIANMHPEIINNNIVKEKSAGDTTHFG